MATQTPLLAIDADAHVIETECTWDYLEPSEQRFRPPLYASPQDPARQYWVDDDLPWILKYAGEHSLVIGTDYGPTDPSSELDAISVLRQMDGISQETKDRIPVPHPRALYNL